MLEIRWRTARALAFASACALGGACGGGATSGPGSTTVAVEPTRGAAAGPVAPVESRFALASALPKDTQVLVEVSDVGATFRALDGLGVFAGEPDLAAVFSTRGWADTLRVAFAMDGGDAERLVGAVASVAFAMRRLPDDPEVALVLRFGDPAPVRAFLATSRFSKLDDEHYAFSRGADVGDQAAPLARSLAEAELSGQGAETLRWIEGPRVLVVGFAGLTEEIGRVVASERASLTEDARFQSAQADVPERALVRAYVDTSMLGNRRRVGADVAEGLFRDPVPWTAALDLGAAGSHFTVTGGFSGRMVPPPDVVPAPIAPTLAALMTRDAWAAWSVSTRIPGGASALAAWLELLAPVEPAASSLRDLLLDDREGAQVVRALGDEALIALVTPTGSMPEVFGGELMSSSAVVVIQSLADPELAKRLLGRLYDEALSGSPRSPKRTPDGFEGPIDDDYVVARIANGRLFVAVGAKAAVSRSREAFEGKGPTLGDRPGYAATTTALPAPAQVRAWLDTKRMLNVLRAQDAAPVPPSLERLPEEQLASAVALTLEPGARGLRSRLETVNFIGYAAAVGVYGVRRYIASSKTAEAKNSISAITRGAVAAFERETMGTNAVVHELCKSAVDVPRDVPSGRKYLASDADGADYQSGDPMTGWRCLKFSMSQPQYYQYAYRAGGNYKGPKRGGPNPGPRGFEVSAEGDLDGDGKTSLFTRTGTVDPRTKQVTVSPDIFIADELE